MKRDDLYLRGNLRLCAAVASLQSHSIARGTQTASRVEFTTRRFICYAVSLLVALIWQ
jgi:hypothetical protein